MFGFLFLFLLIGILIGLVSRMISEGIQIKLLFPAIILVLYVSFVLPFITFPIWAMLNKNEIIKLLAYSGLDKGQHGRKEIANARIIKLKQSWSFFFVLRLWITYILGISYEHDEFINDVIKEVVKLMNEINTKNKLKRIQNDALREGFDYGNVDELINKGLVV